MRSAYRLWAVQLYCQIVISLSPDFNTSHPTNKDYRRSDFRAISPQWGEIFVIFFAQYLLLNLNSFQNLCVHANCSQVVTPSGITKFLFSKLKCIALQISICLFIFDVVMIQISNLDIPLHL